MPEKKPERDGAVDRLAAALRTRRRALNLTVEALAARADISVNTVRNAEGGHPPTLRNVLALADALGCTVGELIDEPDAREEAIRGWSQLHPDERASVERLVAAIAERRPQHRRTDDPARESPPDLDPRGRRSTGR